MSDMKEYWFDPSEIKTLLIKEGTEVTEENVTAIQRILNNADADLKFRAYCKIHVQ